MAEQKISEMPTAAPLDGTELFEVSQTAGGLLSSRKLALSVLAAFLGGAGPKNTTAPVDPTVNDDESQGYSGFDAGGGSLWFNTVSREVFRCADATAGAAEWIKTTLTIDELGSAALAEVEDFATAAQGETADNSEILLWTGI